MPTEANKKLDRKKIKAAIDALSEASFECGEWDRNESDEPYESVYRREEAATQALWSLLKPVIA